MIEKPLPTSFLLTSGSLSWAETRWGVEHGWAEPALFTELATNWLAEDLNAPRNVVLLAGLGRDDNVYEILDLAAGVQGHSGNDSIQASRKWMYLALRWLYENRGRFREPLAEVEEISAEFDFPREISHLIRFMPPMDGYDPSRHTRAENERRLYEKWAKYLENEDERFRSVRGIQDPPEG